MTKIMIAGLLTFSFVLYAQEPVDAKHPCRPKVEARHAARKTLHDCLDMWAKDAKPGDPDPSSDCSSNLSTFVQAAKDVKACRVSVHSKK